MNCEHRYITSTFEKGWHCATCGVQLLSLSMPIPLPLIKRALVALSAGDGGVSQEVVRAVEGGV